MNWSMSQEMEVVPEEGRWVRVGLESVEASTELWDKDLNNVLIC